METLHTLVDHYSSRKLLTTDAAAWNMLLLLQNFPIKDGFYLQLYSTS